MIRGFWKKLIFYFWFLIDQFDVHANKVWKDAWFFKVSKSCRTCQISYKNDCIPIEDLIQILWNNFFTLDSPSLLKLREIISKTQIIFFNIFLSDRLFKFEIKQNNSSNYFYNVPSIADSLCKPLFRSLLSKRISWTFIASLLLTRQKYCKRKEWKQFFRIGIHDIIIVSIRALYIL